MITTVDGLPDGVDGIRVSGMITRRDLETVVVPMLDRAAADHARLRVLALVEDGVDGIAPDAVWEDLALGVRATSLVEGYAMVTDREPVRLAARVLAVLLPYSLRVFGSDDRERAVAWLTGLSRAGFAVDLDGTGGVAVVRVECPLRPADFDVLGRELDRWLSDHAELRGLVLTAPSTPGWESLPALVRHAGFVLEHHRRVRRLALAVDGLLPELAPVLAGQVLHPEIRRFHRANLDAAIAWARAADAAPIGL
jgi:hypothetical protein